MPGVNKGTQPVHWGFPTQMEVSDYYGHLEYESCVQNIAKPNIIPHWDVYWEGEGFLGPPCRKLVTQEITAFFR